MIRRCADFTAFCAILAALTLAGCGFQLRRGHDMAFRSIQLSGFTGTSPLAWLIDQRIQRACSLLRQTDKQITEI